MYIEYEATFIPIEKETIRSKLHLCGATLIHPDRLMKRAVFLLPKGHEIEGGWLRVRDEGDKITMSLKIVSDGRIEEQKEIELIVDNFDNAIEILKTMGATKKAFQESRREMWNYNNCQISIDEWPFLEPYVEVEGPDGETVKNVSIQLGFDWKDAQFCPVGTLIAEKYGITKTRVNDETPLIVFDMKNPFIE